MVANPALEQSRQAAAPYLTQESSAQHQPLIERFTPDAAVPAAEVKTFSQYTAHRIPAEEVIEARQNGTDGPATILHFNHPPTLESKRLAPREDKAEPAVTADKPLRPAPKPRVKVAVKKESPPDSPGATGSKPPRVGVNIEWVQKGVGWDCREVYYVGKQRRRRHLGHIGRQKWEEMQQQYSGGPLEEVLREWIEARRAEKSMSLSGE
jgi:hypothetical protein